MGDRIRGLREIIPGMGVRIQGMRLKDSTVHSSCDMLYLG
jgi:hypothetical protein